MPSCITFQRCTSAGSTSSRCACCCRVALSRVATASERLTDGAPPGVAGLLHVVSTMLSNIDRAPLRLKESRGTASTPTHAPRACCHSAHPASPICTTDLCQALVLDNCFARAGTLAATICASYQEQMVTQLYKLFFSIELLGNPRGLFTKMATGVTDAFYEPMAGLVRGPEEFAHGVLRGGKSLVDNVVVGVTDSIGKITGSLAKGVAELSMDKECAARVPWRNRPHLLLP